MKAFLLAAAIAVSSFGATMDALSTAASDGQYWLNTRTGVLHNKSCRYYGGTSNGYYTDKPEGRDCKICGGARR